LAYILAEYTKQVHLRDISDLIEIENLFDGMPQCPRLLDVGCGGGASLIAINRHQFGGKKPILFGLDIDYQNLSFGKKIIESIFRRGKKVPTISLIQGDGVNLPLKPQSLHILYSRVTFHLLKRHAFLDEAKRVLMSKGRLILVTPGYRYFWRASIHSLRRGSLLSAALSFFCMVNGIILRITGNQIQVRNIVSYADTPPFLAQTLRKAGFHVLKCEYHENPFYVSPIVAIAEKV
jgi:SAM-dependent methyltransferase